MRLLLKKRKLRSKSLYLFRKRILLLTLSLYEESFTKKILTQIYNNFSSDYYTIENTELGYSDTASKLLENKNDFLQQQKKYFEESHYIIMVFPFLISGIPGIMKEWFFKISETKAIVSSKFDIPKNKRALTITYTDFPQETYQPNSLHQSTINRRLHHLNWVTLKQCGFEPFEPVVFYSPVLKNNNTYLSHKSTIESFGNFGSKKSQLEAANENKKDSYNENDKDSKSQFTKQSKKNKNQDMKMREEFLSELGKSIKYIDYFPLLDITDI